MEVLEIRWPGRATQLLRNLSVDQDVTVRDSADEAAFDELVKRYVNLVWATCFRITGDGDLAKDLTQGVFSDLARKTKRIPNTVNLTGWLYRAASFAACKASRDRERRVRREREAMDLQARTPSPSEAERLQSWIPILDEALGKLRMADREAILLRFFREKSLAEIGTILCISEDAAQKRLSRALERLRGQFQKRGIHASSAVLASALGFAGTQAAPAGLAVSIAATAVTVSETAIAGFAPLYSSSSYAINLMKTKFQSQSESDLRKIPGASSHETREPVWK